jgi:hypothetical protein
MNFIMDADYATKNGSGEVSRSMVYSQRIIKTLKGQ